MIRSQTLCEVLKESVQNILRQKKNVIARKRNSLGALKGMVFFLWHL